MKVLLFLSIIISIAFGMTIKSKIATNSGVYPPTDEECLDPNGDCTRPCHNKYEQYGGDCPNGDTYKPANFDYDYSHLYRQ